MTGQELDFYETGFGELHSFTVNTKKNYIIVDITFDGTNKTGKYYCPYRIISRGHAILDIGFGKNYVKIPTLNEKGTKGHVKRKIAYTSDVPRWVINRIEEEIQTNSRLNTKLRKAHNLRKVKIR